jgi:hypothetical protein
MRLNRRRPDSGEAFPAFRSYPFTSNVAPGPFDAWPSRPHDAAAAHADHYNAQRDELTAILIKNGQTEQLFVAKVFAVQRADGGVHTYTTWTQGILTLLPAADVVLLVEQPASLDDQPVMTWVRWDVTASVCADDCWVPMPQFKPARVRTDAWPSADQMQELKARCLR